MHLCCAALMLKYHAFTRLTSNIFCGLEPAHVIGIWLLFEPFSKEKAQSWLNMLRVMKTCTRISSRLLSCSFKVYLWMFPCVTAQDCLHGGDFLWRRNEARSYWPPQPGKYLRGHSTQSKVPFFVCFFVLKHIAGGLLVLVVLETRLCHYNNNNYYYLNLLTSVERQLYPCCLCISRCCSMATWWWALMVLHQIMAPTGFVIMLPLMQFYQLTSVKRTTSLSPYLKVDIKFLSHSLECTFTLPQ